MNTNPEAPQKRFKFTFANRVQAFQLRSHGFSGQMARGWVRRVRNSRKLDDAYSAQEKKRAYDWGFLPDQVSIMGVTEQNRSEFLSERDYRFLHPLNGKYGKWINDRVSTSYVFRPFRDRFEDIYAHIFKRGDQLVVIRLQDARVEFEESVQGLYEAISTRPTFEIVSAVWREKVRWQVSAQGGLFHVDGQPYAPAEFEELLLEASRKGLLALVDHVYVDDVLDQVVPGGRSEFCIVVSNDTGCDPRVCEAFAVFHGDRAARVEEEEDVRYANEEDDEGGESFERVSDLHFESRVDLETGAFRGACAARGGERVELDAHPVTGRPFEGAIPQWDEVKETFLAMARFVPQLVFVEYLVRFTDDGFKIVGIYSHPRYRELFPFEPETRAMLEGRVAAKCELFAKASTRWKRWAHNARLKARRTFGKALYPKGLVPYQSTRWIGDVLRDLRGVKEVPFGQKAWAYRHGFLSYRIPQYGITPDNWRSFISDFEYRWLRHINKKYRYWLEDKITLKYIMPDFSECLPAYYYYTNVKDGVNHVIPMMDCPAHLGATAADVLQLAREKGSLALKPDEGSHGEGFYKLEHREGKYWLNGEEASEERVLGILSDPRNQYIVTEYIMVHPDLKKIYPDSVNTIRLIVFKMDGRHAEIGNAYMRIGSSKTGVVDNLAQGGMLAEVDVETGRYGNAKILDGVIKPCPNHPDTGVLIEGQLPNWEYAKEMVIAMAESLPQLEYFGFDMAITEDGIKLPEINRYPDYPRIDKLNPNTIEYLLSKLDQKKRIYGYDEQPCGKLFSLPRR